MPNGMLSDLEFENQLNELGDNQLALIKFVARQQFASSKTIYLHDNQIKALEGGDRKASTIAGSVSGTISAVIIGIINYFVNRS